MHFLIEQFYNTDVFSWPFFNSSIFLAIILVFMFYKGLVQYLLDWDKIEGQNDSQVQMKTRTRNFLVVNTFVANNYMYLIIWYYFIDSTSIYPTTFEMFAYFLLFFVQSFVLAAVKILDKFIAEVIDAQISFTTTITLQKCEIFRTRVHKLLLLQWVLKL